ncbi:MAG: phosphate ABC transporter substrate-binding protein [Gammaproteobacteria bacterium]|nr:phosphate ABC transporter substrate-binding protein [Gammaproteobacteria bacterium]
MTNNMRSKRIFAAFAALMVASVLFSVEARTLIQIQNKGSDTLVNVVQAWSDAYRKRHGDVNVTVSGGGSGTGIAALINGSADIVNTSRKMKSREISLAEKRGRNPVQHLMGYDAIAIFLHKDNPADSLNFEQLAEIYGKGGKANKWSDFGITVPGCIDQKIMPVGRQNNSGTYAVFRKRVLGDRRNYKMGSRNLHGSKEVVTEVEKTPCAIGYSSRAYVSSKVKTACIAKKKDDTCIVPSIENTADQTYSLVRPLFIYTNDKPEGEIKKYLDWVFGKEGQCILQAQGYAPIRAVECK